MWVKFKINSGLGTVNKKVVIFLKVVKLSWNFRLIIPVVFWLLLPQGQDTESKAVLWT